MLSNMKLFLAHCGFYSLDVGDGIYESHTNFFIVAEDFDDAKSKVKEMSVFKEKKMHVDGLQEIQAVDGFKVTLNYDASLGNKTFVVHRRHRDLVPKEVSKC